LDNVERGNKKMNNKPYDAQYKLELLELIENGQNVGDIAQKYDIPVKTIRRWMDERRRDRKHTYSRKGRSPEYQEQHDYATDRSGSVKGQGFMD